MPGFAVGCAVAIRTIDQTRDRGPGDAHVHRPARVTGPAMRGTMDLFPVTCFDVRAPSTSTGWRVQVSRGADQMFVRHGPPSLLPAVARQPIMAERDISGVRCFGHIQGAVR